MPDDHQECEDAVPWIVACSFNRFPYQVWISVGRRLRWGEMAGEGAVGEVPVLEIGQFAVIKVGPKRTPQLSTSSKGSEKA
jgi:hypothetical protein